MDFVNAFYHMKSFYPMCMSTSVADLILQLRILYQSINGLRKMVIIFMFSDMLI